MSRHINAQELKQLAEYYRSKGDETTAQRYDREEEDLQAEMNRD